MNASSQTRRSMRRVADRTALRVLVNAQAKANEIVRLASAEAESLRDDARAYVRAVAYEAEILREEAERLRAEAEFLRPATDDSGVGQDAAVGAAKDRAGIDLDDQFDRYIDLDMGDDPAKDWMLGSRG